MRTRRWSPQQWIAAGTFAFPAVVLVHELGHFLAACALGFADVRLHFMSVSVPELEVFWSRFAAGELPEVPDVVLWQGALPISAGVAATYLMLLFSCTLVARGHTHPLIVWIGLAAPLRFYFSAGVVWKWIVGHPIPLTAEDESRLAAAFGVPQGALVAFGIVVSLLASGWLLRRVPVRFLVVVPCGAVGVFLGIVLYGGLIGPLLLP